MLTRTIRVRQDLADNWFVTDSSLACGEIGFETDTGKFKIGDGILSWNTLGYSTKLPSELDNDYATKTHNHSGTYEPAITKLSGFNLSLGNSIGTISEGNHLHTGIYATASQGTKADAAQPALSGTGFIKASGTTISYDNSTYLTTSVASSTYLSISAASSTYLTAVAASSTYLTTTAASSTYLTSFAASSTYLTTTIAGSTYAPLASPAFTGTISGGGLGTAAFTASTAYATAAQGTLAENALPSTSYKPLTTVINGYTSTSGTIESTDTIKTAIEKLGYDQHVPITIGTANGLSLSTQALSLAAASTAVTGALTSTDWNTFNGKQAALSGSGFIKVSGTTISYDNSAYLTEISKEQIEEKLTGEITTHSHQFIAVNIPPEALPETWPDGLNGQIVIYNYTTGIDPDFTYYSDLYVYKSGIGWEKIQPWLSGTGFVKSTAGVISYDTSEYLTTTIATSTYAPLAIPTVAVKPTVAPSPATIGTMRLKSDGSQLYIYIGSTTWKTVTLA